MADTRDQRLKKRIHEIAAAIHQAGPAGEQRVKEAARNHVDHHVKTHTTPVEVIDKIADNLEKKAQQFKRIASNVKTKEKKEASCWTAIFNFFYHRGSTNGQDTRYHKLEN